jgi:hypothetical protein
VKASSPSVRATTLRRIAKPSAVLERLEAGEALSLLHRLLSAHPDLRSEAEEMARALLAEIDFEAVGEDVEDALRALDINDLNDRAGCHRDGYTDPTEAAWELLQEAIDPFLVNMKRQTELGLSAQALETCKGVLLGLYRIRERKGDELLGWAPDFPEEAAVRAVDVLAGGDASKTARSAHKPLLDGAFLAERLPEWCVLIAQRQGCVKESSSLRKKKG